jgi:D-tyrosyl-tRNA(Tyr) deacylase
MRAVVQRVVRASVTIKGAVHSEIEKGLCMLLGITHNDTPDDIDWIVRKLLNLKLWPNDGGKEWAANVTNVTNARGDAGAGAELLVVSQFTLYAKVSKGTKPDFHNAMPGERSKQVYLDVLDRLAKGYRTVAVKDCVFGAMMEVAIVNDGPVTIVLDSHQRDPALGAKLAAPTRAPADGAEGAAPAASPQ